MRAFFSGLTLFCMLAALGCGSSDDGDGAGGTAGTGGGTGSGGAGGSAGAATGPICPTKQPKAGDACDDDGLECTFGTTIQPSCRLKAKCTSGAWETELPPCAQQGAGCPPEPNAPSDGTLCSDTTASCAYLKGTMCKCLECPPGGTCPPPVSAHWYCAPPPEESVCPSTAPNQGTACNVSGETECRYGSCETEGPYIARCENGAWSWSLEACPAS